MTLIPTLAKGMPAEKNIVQQAVNLTCIRSHVNISIVPHTAQNSKELFMPRDYLHMDDLEVCPDLLNMLLETNWNMYST